MIKQMISKGHTRYGQVLETVTLDLTDPAANPGPGFFWDHNVKLWQRAAQVPPYRPTTPAPGRLTCRYCRVTLSPQGTCRDGCGGPQA